MVFYPLSPTNNTLKTVNKKEATGHALASLNA